jgi:hypothetical protein
MVTVDQMTKTLQVVLQKIQAARKNRFSTYGCHINDRILVTNFFVHCPKIRAKTKMSWVAIKKKVGSMAIVD